MKKPYINGLKPWKKEYEAHEKKIILYSYYEPIGREYYDSDNDYCKFCGGLGCNGDCHKSGARFNKDQPPTPNVNLSDINLQFLINLLPEGVTPAQVKIEIKIDASDMAYEGQSVTFYYMKNFPTDMKRYKQDLAAYMAAEKAYKIKRAAYDTWEKHQEIEKLEEQLLILKKKK